MRIAVVNLKGGVGKTTAAVHLAGALAAHGRTLLADADPQGSALSWSELVPELPYETVALPVRDLHRRLRTLAAGFDHVVIDTPPGLESAAIVRSAALAAEVAIVPLAPSSMDADRLRATLELLQEVEPLNPALEVRVLLNRVRAGTRLGRALPELLGVELGVPLLEAHIPLREVYAGAFGRMPDIALDYAGVLSEVQP